MTSRKGWPRSSATLALLLTLLWIAPASAGDGSAATDSIPPADASLREVLDARDGGAWRWPLARAQRAELLADQLLLEAQVADTAGAVRAAFQDSLAVRDDREDALHRALRWARVDIEALKTNQRTWWDRHALEAGLILGALLWALTVKVTAGW